VLRSPPEAQNRGGRSATIAVTTVRPASPGKEGGHWVTGSMTGGAEDHVTWLLFSTQKPWISSRKSLQLERSSESGLRVTGELSVSLSLSTEDGGGSTSATVTILLTGWEVQEPLF